MHDIETVIATGRCVGCGACSVATGGAVSVTLLPTGMHGASLGSAARDAVARGDRVCPFSDRCAHKITDVVRAVENGSKHQDDVLGAFIGTYAGRVSDEDALVRSSSGGLTTWLIAQLLERRLVDGVVHVGQSEPSLGGLEHHVSSSLDALERGRKSQYYSTTLAAAIDVVRTNPGYYAIVGVPCFITAARALAATDKVLSDRLRYFVGIVCGHMKSQAYAESLAWQVGVEPQNLLTIDFRVKIPGRPSSDYGFRAVSKHGKASPVVPSRQLLGTNWGHVAFQPEACNVCEDIFAESADVSFGDAWLPEYTSDWRGTNVVVTRHEGLDRILEDGSRSGEIVLEPLTPARAARSQAGNIRHRRVGLAVRLHDDRRAGRSIPSLRTLPDVRATTLDRRLIVRYRRRMSQWSFAAFAQAKERGNLKFYTRRFALARLIYRGLELNSRIWQAARSVSPSSRR